jgi:hypothetical protein
MKRWYRILIAVSLILLGCSTPDFVVIKVSSSRSLGLVDGPPRKIEVCLYQLERVEPFRELRASPEGLKKLRECAPFHDSVVTVERFEVEPGAGFTRDVNRAPGAKYMAVVANFPEKAKGPVARYVAFEDETVHLYLGKEHVSFH